MGKRLKLGDLSKPNLLKLDSEIPKDCVCVHQEPGGRANSSLHTTQEDLPLWKLTPASPGATPTSRVKRLFIEFRILNFCFRFLHFDEPHGPLPTQDIFCGVFFTLSCPISASGAASKPQEGPGCPVAHPPR